MVERRHSCPYRQAPGAILRNTSRFTPENHEQCFQSTRLSQFTLIETATYYCQAGIREREKKLNLCIESRAEKLICLFCIL
jgi:hypothetical protein